MSSTLLLRSPGVLSAPIPGTPTLPDTNTGLIMTLDAASLMSLADGQSIDSWVAAGTAALVNRTFNFQFTNWGKPTLSRAGGPGGKPAAMFNGSQHISNSPGSVAINQPLTYALVVKSAKFATSQARVIASGNQIITPGSTGYHAVVSGGGTLFSLDKTTDWTVLIATFNDATSKLKVGNGAIITGPTGNAAAGRNTLGGQGTTLADTGLVGGIAYMKVYNRALTDSDIEGLSSGLRQQFGMA